MSKQERNLNPATFWYRVGAYTTIFVCGIALILFLPALFSAVIMTDTAAAVTSSTTWQTLGSVAKLNVYFHLVVPWIILTVVLALLPLGFCFLKPEKRLRPYIVKLILNNLVSREKRIEHIRKGDEEEVKKLTEIVESKGFRFEEV